MHPFAYLPSDFFRKYFAVLPSYKKNEIENTSFSRKNYDSCDIEIWTKRSSGLLLELSLNSKETEEFYTRNFILQFLIADFFKIWLYTFLYFTLIPSI